MRQLSTNTLSNQNIATALNAASYTADADRWLVIRLACDQVAGNGVYTAYIAIQRLGAGSFYEVQPRTTATVASGVTAIAFVTIPFPVKNTDVVKVYILGLAGDTTTPDITVGIWEDDSLRPTTADRTLDVSATGEAGVDWANVGSPTATVDLSGTTVDTVTTTTTAGSVSGAVGSVTGDVGGNVVGSVASVTAGVTVTTNNDKTDYALSSAGIQAIWDALTSALTTAGSIGKMLVDNLNATISSVVALLGTPVGADISADIAAVQADTDNIQTRLPAALTGGKMDSAATLDAGDITDIANAVISGVTVVAAADVWASPVRTLTSVTPGATLVATIVGTTLNMTRAVTYGTIIPNLIIPSNWAKIYFTAKTSVGDTDAQSQIQIVISNPGAGGDGLLYVNGGVAALAANGTLTVDQPGGNVGIAMTDDGTLLLSSGGGLTYDIKVITDTSTSTVLTTGLLNIGVTPTLAVS